jgi:hypothetical protein
MPRLVKAMQDPQNTDERYMVRCFFWDKKLCSMMLLFVTFLTISTIYHVVTLKVKPLDHGEGHGIFVATSIEEITSAQNEYMQSSKRLGTAFALHHG